TRAGQLSVATYSVVPSNQFNVTPLKDQGSGILRSMSEANCFIVLHEDMAHLEKDMWVDIQLFTSLF
ncbi:MAG: Molybdopterin molybdenumtransferase, partial [Pseudomonadota bacterium]